MGEIEDNMQHCDMHTPFLFKPYLCNNLPTNRLRCKYQPEVVLCNAIRDRHIDHGRGSQLASEACFLSGLVKIETRLGGKKQEAWRPKIVYHYI